MKQILFRGIVLVLLAYTGFEIASPQFCGEKSLSILGGVSANATSQTNPQQVVTSSVKNHKELPGSQQNREVPKDDDCFCCCAHVMPSPTFETPKTSELALVFSSYPKASIPTVSLHAPYHPPRSV